MNGFFRTGWMSRALAASAGLMVLAGCSHSEWHYVTLQDVNVSMPPTAPADAGASRAGAPAERLQIDAGGPRTALVAYKAHNDPEHDFGQWGRAFVVVLDGPPATGKVEVSPQNGRLVFDAAYSPARRPYVGLEGYVNILSVNGPKVTAYCVLRSEIIDAYDKPYILRGTYEFQTASGNESFLHSGGLEVAGPVGQGAPAAK